MRLLLRHGLLALAFSASAAPALADIEFTVREYQIKGAEVEPETVRPYLGAKRSLADIQGAARAVEQRLGPGWRVIIVPDQDVTDGTVRFEAVRAEQPRIVAVQDTSEVADYFTGLRLGQPFDPVRARAQAAMFRDLTGEFAQVDARNEGKGIAVTLLAPPSVAKDPTRFTVAIDNTGTSDTGMNRLTLTGSHYNLWGKRHVGSATAVFSTSRPADVRVLVGTYRMPLFDQDSLVDFYAADSQASAGEASGFAISGKGTIFGMRGTRYLALKDIPGTHQISVALEQRNLDSEITLGGAVVTLAPNYAIRPLILGYGYTQAGRLSASVTLSQGLGGGRAGGSTLGQVRVGAKGDYTILRANGEMLLPLPHGLTGRVAANLQYTNDALVPAEQFGLGGAGSVRGLQERETSNDKGYRISLEASKPLQGETRALMFLDVGKVSRNNAQVGDPGTEHATSTGIGFRFGERTKWSGSIDVAHVLQGTQATSRGDTRVHFQFAAYF